jgi:hypothetical protein
MSLSVHPAGAGLGRLCLPIRFLHHRLRPSTAPLVLASSSKASVLRVIQEQSGDRAARSYTGVQKIHERARRQSSPTSSRGRESSLPHSHFQSKSRRSKPGGKKFTVNRPLNLH